MHPRLGLPLLCLATLLACAKPTLTIAVAPGADPAAYRSVALDPRKDLAYVIDGVRPLNPAHLKEVALRGMEGLGYAVLPEEGAEGAELWLEVFAFGLAQGQPGAGAGEVPKGGGRSGGGHGRGGGGSMGGGKPSGGNSGQRTSKGGEKLLVQLLDRREGRVIWSGTWEQEAGAKAKPTPGFEDPWVVHLQEILGNLPPRKAAGR